MTADTTEVAKELRERALEMHAAAWSRPDGGQECTIGASLCDAAANEIERLTAENARLRAERDAAWQAGAEVMREAAARTADKHPYPAKTAESLWGIERTCIGNAIRALPLPGQPKEVS